MNRNFTLNPPLHSASTALPRTGRRALCALTAVAALAWPMAHAEMPSLETVIQFTGNRAEGGNGAFPPTGNSTILYPTRVFIEDSSGNLYGASAGGGGYAMATNAYGVGGLGELFYRYSPAGGQTILDRGIDSGNLRPKQMTVASNGRLYSIEGAATNQGALRRYTPGTGWDILAPTPFNIATPWVEGADGRLYNTRAAGLDLYAVDKDGAAGVQTIHTFSNTVMARAILAMSHSNGRLFGYGAILRNTGGGNAFRPLVFSIRPDGTDAQVHKESIGDAGTIGGGNVVSSLVEAADGRVYGATLQGGANNNGIIFRINADGSAYEVLHEFGPTTANTGGRAPTSLVLGADGHLYGTAQFGGVNGNGVIFRWNTVSSAYEALYAFNGLTPHTAMGSNTGTNPDGTRPLGFMRARDGTLYGMAQLGGQYGWGTVFKFNPGDEVPVFKFQPQITLNATARNNIGSGGTTSARTIALGREVTFTWSSQLAANCVASSTEPGNPWRGSRAIASSGDAHTPAQLGTWNYTLTCDSTSIDFPDAVVATYTIQVVSTEPVPETGGNGGGGGGALGWLAGPLALLGAMGWRRRRMARDAA